MALTCPVIVRMLDTNTHADATGSKTTTTVALEPQAGGSIALAITGLLQVTMVGGVPAGVAVGNQYTLSIG